MNGELHLIAEIAGQRVAVSAEHVESVVEIDRVTPTPRVAAHVRGLAALRSRVITLIDTRVALGLPPAPASTPGAAALQAVIYAAQGHVYGLLIDRVDDVASAAGPPRPHGAAMAPGWARCTRGLIEIAGEPVLLLDPEAVIEGGVVAGAGMTAAA